MFLTFPRITIHASSGEECFATSFAEYFFRPLTTFATGSKWLPAPIYVVYWGEKAKRYAEIITVGPKMKLDGSFFALLSLEL
jgi:hypothetical protein